MLQAEAARETDIALAKSLLKMRKKRSYMDYGCSSVEMFGSRLGYEPHEMRRLLKLGEAMDAESSVEERVRAKALSVPAAVELAPVLTEPELFPEKDEWLRNAQDDSYSKFRRHARHRLAEIRFGEAIARSLEQRQRITGEARQAQQRPPFAHGQLVVGEPGVSAAEAESGADGVEKADAD